LFLELLENKVAELKIQNNYNHFNKDKNSEKENNFKRINTIIDLNIEAYLPNDFFTSELDKLNFYRELESVKQLEDLDNIIDSFNEFNNKNNPDTVNSTSTQNLFNLLKLKILAS
jgi:transcription-repair coupling factor (superfamily II helicase)